MAVRKWADKWVTEALSWYDGDNYVCRFIGNVTTVDDLPTENNNLGDKRSVSQGRWHSTEKGEDCEYEEGDYGYWQTDWYYWNGTAWINEKTREYEQAVGLQFYFDVYSDPDDPSAGAYLHVNPFCAWTGDAKSTMAPDPTYLKSLLPMTVNITTSLGFSITFKTTTTVQKYGQLPGDPNASSIVERDGVILPNVMKHSITNSEANRIPIPTDNSEFTITFNITNKKGQSISFTNTACGVKQVRIINMPEYITTGKSETFQLNEPFESVRYQRVLIAQLIWDPPKFSRTVNGVKYNVDHRKQIHEAYIDSDGRQDSITAGYWGKTFDKIYFAVHNPGLPEVQEAWSDAYIRLGVEMKYGYQWERMSLFAENQKVQIRPREYIDRELWPERGGEGFTVDPEIAVIHGKYVLHCIDEMEFNPLFSRKFIWDRQAWDDYLEYGEDYNSVADDSLTRTFYERYGHGTRIHSIHTDNFSVVEGFKFKPNAPLASVKPGDEHGEYTATYTVYIEDQWSRGLYEDPDNQQEHTGRRFDYSFQVLVYERPKITALSIHRVLADPNGEYTDGTNKYTKDDYGDHCLIEYGAQFKPLDCGNEMWLKITYGHSSVLLYDNVIGETEADYVKTGYIIVPASTERTLNVTVEARDTFTKSGVSQTLRLSTALTLMDFMRDGDGIGIGMVAQADKHHTLSINPEWAFRFHRGYIYEPGTNNRVDVVQLMKDIDISLQELRQSTFLQYPNTGHIP